MAYTSIDNPELYFQVKAYSGTGDDNAGTDDSLALTFDGSENMQPDLMWFKGRNFADNHVVIDSVRGVTKAVYPDSSGAETTQSHYLKTIDSDGMTLGDSGIMNRSGRTYVAWCWKESATAGFDIVSYTGNATNRTISHSLSAVPAMMIFKNRADSTNWVVYHHKNTSAPETDYLYLSTTAATADYAAHFNDTAPTSSVFSLGTDNGVNDNTDAHMAYLWTEKQGFSKFGSYSGNGNADGPFVYTGFRPAFLLIKCTDNTRDWQLLDNKLNSYNPTDICLRPNVNNGDQTGNSLDFLSNGFKVRLDGASFNTSGGSYVYMAFAEAPFVNSEGVPGNAR